MKLITKIKEYRAKNSMTQDTLAKVVGVRRETIVHLENGRYNPSLKLAFDIAKALNTTVDEIFDFTNSED
jgi:DNA-binding XRE family transcriptional regulator